MTNRRLVMIAGMLVLAVLGYSYYISIPRGPDAFASCGAAAIAGGDVGGPFELVDETGQTVTDVDVITKPTLVYFGYTYCPDVCPLDSARNAMAYDFAKENGVDLGFTMISVDPERDTPDEMARFTDNFHPDMLGLTGTVEQVRDAAGEYKAYFQKQDADDPEYYLVDHSAQTYLAVPKYGVVDFFSRSDSAEVIADRAECIADVFQRLD